MQALKATDTGRAPRRPAKAKPPTTIPGGEAADIETLLHLEASRLAIEIDGDQFPAKTVVDACRKARAGREDLNTDSEVFGGSNVGNGGRLNAHDEESRARAASLRLTLPPLPP